MSTARNDITRALIKSRLNNSAYDNNYDAIFGKKKVELTLEDRAVGSLVGLAIGDAIGTTVEFSPRGSFPEVTDMTGGGPFGLLPGQWTDDTSMALCLATSLLEKGFDPLDQMCRYENWMKHGDMSSNGYCFDIGNTTRFAIHEFGKTRDPYSGTTHEDGSGNGSLMRLVPVVLHAYPDMDKVMNDAMNSSRTTHGADKPIECCQLFADILCGVLDGLPKNELLAAVTFSPDNLEVISIAAGTFLEKSIDEIEGSGYCVESLEAALWCFFKTESFEECILKAVNLGRDADTTAAIAGQIAGAFYGIQSIRKDWVEKITMSEFIQKTAKELVKNK